MPSTDADPDLSRMAEGNEYKVFYCSKRSGNEIDRTGTCTVSTETEAGNHLVRLHDERRGCFKHAYFALAETETNGGDEVVAAYSITAEAEPPNRDAPPRIGQHYEVTFEAGRTSLLGIVDRVVREDGPEPFLVTDGGRDMERSRGRL